MRWRGKVAVTGLAALAVAGAAGPAAVAAGAAGEAPVVTVRAVLSGTTLVRPDCEDLGYGVAEFGAFVVERGGPVDAPLDVAYTVGGTGVPGDHYEALPGTLTIPAGAASANVEIVPRPGPASVTFTVALALVDTDAYDAGEAVLDEVLLARPRDPALGPPDCSLSPLVVAGLAPPPTAPPAAGGTGTATSGSGGAGAELPFTGSASATLALVAAALVALGALLALATPPRRASYARTRTPRPHRRTC